MTTTPDDTPDDEAPELAGVTFIDGDAAQRAERITYGNFAAELCKALGVDPEANQGFTLTTIGGQIPELTVYALPPQEEDGTPADGWVDDLAGIRGRGISFAVLPGQSTTAPPARDRGDAAVPPVGHPAYHDAQCARVLLLAAEVINGAYIDGDTREWLTVTARSLADEADRRSFAHIGPMAFGVIGDDVPTFADPAAPVMVNHPEDDDRG